MAKLPLITRGIQGPPIRRKVLGTNERVVPFVPFDWTMPKLAAIRSVDDKTQNLNLSLLSLSATYLLRPPTVTNVRAIIPRRRYEIDHNLLLTLLPTTLKPLTNNNLDWMRQQQVQVRAWEATQNQLILSTTLAPFSNRQIEVARAPFTPRRYSDDPAQNLLLTLLAPTASAPFAPTDWAQLRGAIPRQSEQTQNLLLTLLPTTLRPFVPQKSGDDRSPMICVRQYENVQSLNLTLFPSAVPPTPGAGGSTRRHLPMMGVGR